MRERERERENRRENERERVKDRGEAREMRVNFELWNLILLVNSNTWR